MDEVAAGHGSARPIGVGRHRVRLDGPGPQPRPMRASGTTSRICHSSPNSSPVADEVPGRAEEAAAQFGFTTAVQDWREVLTDSRVEAVSVTAPNWLHREIGVAVAEAGRHLWIEKPVGVTADDARAVGAAVDAAGVQSAVGFNYRNAPAVAHGPGDARCRRDRAGHARPVLLPERLRRVAGGGVDLALRTGARRQRGARRPRLARASTWCGSCWVTSPRVVADTAVFLPERARPAGATAGHSRVVGGELGPVENEDYVSRAAAHGLRCAGRPGGQPGRRRRAEQRTASRCTAPWVRCPGTSAGWASSPSARAVAAGPAGGHRVRGARAPGITPPSSPARGSRWATTT